jgi:hypothetical protein
MEHVFNRGEAKFRGDGGVKAANVSGKQFTIRGVGGAREVEEEGITRSASGREEGPTRLKKGVKVLRGIVGDRVIASDNRSAG